MNQVTLGKTGITVEKNSFGALPIQRISREEAVKLLPVVNRIFKTAVLLIQNFKKTAGVIKNSFCIFNIGVFIGKQ